MQISLHFVLSTDKYIIQFIYISVVLSLIFVLINDNTYQLVFETVIYYKLYETYRH